MYFEARGTILNNKIEHLVSVFDFITSLGTLLMLCVFLSHIK